MLTLKTYKVCLSVLACLFTYSTKHAALSRAVTWMLLQTFLSIVWTDDGREGLQVPATW